MPYGNVRNRSAVYARSAARLLTIPEVEHAALVSGDTDIVLLVRTHDIAALRELVLNSFQSMPEVLSVRRDRACPPWRAGPVRQLPWRAARG
jgi:DNA-binding Lrp family transcriptional regulator